MMTHSSPQTIITYILSSSDHALAGMTPENLCERFACESETMVRDFKRQMKIDLVDYLSRERVYRAVQQILKHRVASMRKLSESLGFESQERFSREFQRFFCVEPERYFYLMEVKRFKRELSIRARDIAGIESY